ncbi:WbqC family protein [Sulfurimonas sp.]|uniref:WbqC family protein n=1 Tax=Sulfurimonas sp. TaxID=2022749 RepID=UPI0035629210
MLDLSNKLVCITQPEHLPWLGYLDKIAQSDYLIFLDNVQFKKRHFENRNKIRVNNKDGFLWLTVPVITKGKYEQKINEVEIDYSGNWIDKYLKSIEYNYNKSKYFNCYFNDLKDILYKKHKYLVDLNIDIINFMKVSFGLNTKFLKASEICNDGKSSELILNILKSLNSNKYFSGKFGGIDVDLLEINTIKVSFQDFKEPKYSQLTDEYLPGMAFIDLLFNHGENGLQLIYGNTMNKEKNV